MAGDKKEEPVPSSRLGRFARVAKLAGGVAGGMLAEGSRQLRSGKRPRARDMLLAVVVFPLVAPVLLACVVATRELFAGAPVSEIYDWINILLAFDIAFATAAVMLFEPLVAD